MNPFQSNDERERLSKEQLIRELARERVQNNPLLSFLGNIDCLCEAELLGIPEATIVCIVETFYLLKEQGLAAEKALEAIEVHRSMFGDAGQMPCPLTLQSYIKYRVLLEHPHGLDLSNEYIERAMRRSVSNYE